MKFRYKKVKLIIYSLAVVIVIFGVATLIKSIIKPLDNLFIPNNLPAKTIQTDIPVNFNILFSNELDINNKQVSGTSFFPLIEEKIDKAQGTIEIAMYSFKSEFLREAIYRASARGVKVTLLLDIRKLDGNNEFFKDLPINIRRLDLGASGSQTALMHHKFVIIDRGLTSENIIFGSFNWTELQAVYDRSFLVFSDNHEFIESFGREFDRLSNNVAEKKKLSDKNYHPWDLSMKSNGYNYEVWYGPGWRDNSYNNRIIELLNEAKTDIKIMLWDFTDKSLAQEILNRARAGVKVTIIGDSFNYSGTSSVFKLLSQIKIQEGLDNLEVLDDTPANLTGQIVAATTLDPFLHNHLLIIDNKQVLFGTNNWSINGAYYNDESLVISDDPKILNQFLSSFFYNYKLSKKTPGN